MWASQICQRSDKSVGDNHKYLHQSRVTEVKFYLKIHIPYYHIGKLIVVFTSLFITLYFIVLVSLMGPFAYHTWTLQNNKWIFISVPSFHFCHIVDCSRIIRICIKRLLVLIHRPKSYCYSLQSNSSSFSFWFYRSTNQYAAFEIVCVSNAKCNASLQLYQIRFYFSIFWGNSKSWQSQIASVFHTCWNHIKSTISRSICFASNIEFRFIKINASWKGLHEPIFKLPLDS